MTLTDLLVPTYRNMLQTLKGLLDEAEAQLGAGEAEALLSARLAPDIFPLATPVMPAIALIKDAKARNRIFEEVLQLNVAGQEQPAR